ncbi:MAG: GntP family permease [Bacteroidales bacterium]|nr:GntP family permease [Candidatus Cryptobacteroides onthequi]
MISGLYLILFFILSIVLMITAMSRWKVHPFIAIMVVSLVFGLVAGLPIVDRVADGKTTPGIMNVIGQGFAGIFSGIGLVIILGALIGAILEKTGAALKLADMIVRLVGRKNPVAAMGLMGWVVSIAVFCDSGFVVLNPIRKALVKRTATSSVAMTVALSAGLFLSHVFIPPTPGPLASANTLGLADNIAMVMGLGILCSILPMAAALIFAGWIGGKVKAEDESDISENAQSYEELVASYGRLPGGFASVAPILIPILLMASSTIVKQLGVTGQFTDAVMFLSTPVMALSIGTVIAWILLRYSGRGGQMSSITEETLKTVGPILFITAAGGVLGKVVASSGMTAYITEHASLLRGMGIFFPFILAAILKSSLGSSTVAIITTAGIISPLLGALGFASPVQAGLVCMAISAGAMTVSHANDSYFWVVTNFGGMDMQKGYRTQTLMTLIMGIAAILEIFILSLLLK